MYKKEESSRTGGPLPRATVHKSKQTWLLWLIPLGAVGICLWFFYRDYISSGPLITIHFQNAEGLEQENTQLIYRGAQVGEVKKVTLAADQKSVEVKTRLASSARNLARAGSVFWIVRPQMKVGAISGLRTIVSGEYIAVQPGNGPETNIFTGVEKPPVTAEPRALQITLLMAHLGSLQEQSPVFYRGIAVGEVTDYQLGSDSRQVAVHARILEPYAPLVRMDSKFWNAGGFDFHLGLFKGVQITAESPKTIVSGGIEFATPTEYQGPATNGTVFSLFEKPDEKWKTWAPSIPVQAPTSSGQTNETKAPSL